MFALHTIKRQNTRNLVELEKRGKSRKSLILLGLRSTAFLYTDHAQRQIKIFEIKQTSKLRIGVDLSSHLKNLSEHLSAVSHSGNFFFFLQWTTMSSFQNRNP